MHPHMHPHLDPHVHPHICTKMPPHPPTGSFLGLLLDNDRAKSELDDRSVVAQASSFILAGEGGEGDGGLSGSGQ